MPEFHDFFISENLRDKAEELGWSSEGLEASVRILEADDWGELKQKIGRKREDHDILGFRGGNHELNRKAFSNPRMDVVLHPGKDRKDSGMNHVDAEKAAENNVAVGLSLKTVPEDGKRQSQVLSKWRRNIKLCRKYGASYIITTEADSEAELRKPRDLAAVTRSLGGEGNRAVAKHSGKILEKNLKARKNQTGYSGVEAVK